MKIGVIVPIINDKFIGALLKSIEANTIQPDRILIIDNRTAKYVMQGETKIWSCPKPLGFQYGNAYTLQTAPSMDKSWSVNESWNFGIQYMAKENMDLFSVMNDDIEIEKYFFEKLLLATSKYLNGGIFVPETLNALSGLKNALPMGSGQCSGIRKREGWCWTIRAEVTKHIPPIPDVLKTFCGDDWYWHKCNALNRPWLKMINNWCYHYVGVSVRETDVRKDLLKEKRLLSSLL